MEPLTKAMKGQSNFAVNPPPVKTKESFSANFNSSQGMLSVAGFIAAEVK